MPEKSPAKIDDINRLFQILSICLQVNRHPVVGVEIGAKRSVDRQHGLNATSFKVQPVDDLLTVLRNRIILCPQKLEG